MLLSRPPRVSVIIMEHNHLTDTVGCQVEQVRHTMKSKASSTNDRPNQIFTFTAAPLSEDIKARMALPDTSKRVLCCTRAAHRPKNPHSLQELDITGDWASKLHCDNDPEADERFIIFTSSSHLQQLVLVKTGICMVP